MPEKQGIIPGSFKSTINLGTRYVPAPTPGQAAWNTFLRNYTPWGPFGVDEPPTGTGGIAGRLSGAVPYVGGLLQALQAGVAASEQQGRMVKVPPRAGWFQNLLQTIGNTLAFAPPSQAMSIVKPIVSGISGLAGAPSMFNTSWQQMLAGVGGTATRELADRTGVWKAMTSEPGFAGGGVTSQPSSNPFTDPVTGFTPAWAGGPSTWNQPRSTWGDPRWPAIPSTVVDYQ